MASKATVNKEVPQKINLKKSNSQGPFSHLAAAAMAIGAINDLPSGRKDSLTSHHAPEGHKQGAHQHHHANTAEGAA